MRKRINIFIVIFLFFVLMFFIQKIIFMLSHTGIVGSYPIVDYMRVLYHGLPLDLSMSGYLTILPSLTLIASSWLNNKTVGRILNIYFAVAITFIVAIAVADIIVYPYWGFHFDASAFIYLKNPKEAAASASSGELIVALVLIILFSIQIYRIYSVLIKRRVHRLDKPKLRMKTGMVLVLLTAALFLPIRGGITVSTMNIGKVYFSTNMFLNHAAINPQFNLMYSLTKNEDFASQYQFFDKEDAEKTFNEMQLVNESEDVPQLLNIERPNILLFILESFSTEAISDTIVAPNMHQFAKEAISFANFYANSFRTDRGLVSILSGYPAHPTTAIIKYPQKTQSLPSIPKTLYAKGYNSSFYYGGDVDFANMRSYIVGSCKTENIVGDKDFSIRDRMTKWGVPDDKLLDKVFRDLTLNNDHEPFIKSVLTLSSHEPFDVPTRMFDEPYLNSIHYSDSCLGVFVNKLKETKLWDKTLIILVADHGAQSYPKSVSNYSPQRFHIPMLWMGGAVKTPMIINSYGSQNDIAATLLSQLNINYNEFIFSKDMLNPSINPFAFYSYMNGFSMIDSTGSIIYDNNQEGLMQHNGDRNLEKKAKAFFQNMYIDLSKR